MPFGYVQGMLLHCPNCLRTTWQHVRGKQIVCRGDIRPSQIHRYEALITAGVYPGCQREIENTNGAN